MIYCKSFIILKSKKHKQFQTTFLTDNIWTRPKYWIKFFFFSRKQLIDFHDWNSLPLSLELSLCLALLWFVRLFPNFLLSTNLSLTSISLVFIFLSNAVFFFLFIVFILFFFFFLFLLNLFSFILFSLFISISFLTYLVFSVFLFYSNTFRIPFSVAFLLPLLACITFIIFIICLVFWFTSPSFFWYFLSSFFMFILLFFCTCLQFRFTSHSFFCGFLSSFSCLPVFLTVSYLLLFYSDLFLTPLSAAFSLPFLSWTKETNNPWMFFFCVCSY